MPHSNSQSTIAVNGSVNEFEDYSAYPQDTNNTSTVADDKTLAAERIQVFVNNNALHSTHTYGSRTPSQARLRMAEVLQDFGKVFDATGIRE